MGARAPAYVCWVLGFSVERPACGKQGRPLRRSQVGVGENLGQPAQLAAGLGAQGDLGLGRRGQVFDQQQRAGSQSRGWSFATQKAPSG